MKVYYQSPKDHVIVVKPDPNEESYELWLIRPTLLGHCDKRGTQRIHCEGLQFTNINSAAQHLLEKRGETKLAAEQSHYVKSTAAKTAVKGVEIAMRGNWQRFCQHKKLTEFDEKLLQKSYQLTREELVEFGLKQPGE